MLVAREHVQLFIHLAAQRTLRKHALHGEFDRALRVFLEQLAEGDRLDAADGAGVVVVNLVIELVARYFDLLRVQHDDVIAHVDVRAEDGLVLALEAHGNLRAETAQDLVGRIHDKPVAAHGFRFRKNSRHHYNSNHRKSPHRGCRYRG